MSEVRTYKKRVEAAQHNMTPEEISRAKNQRCKQRNEVKKSVKAMEAEARNIAWRKLKPEQQLAQLPQGGAKKQRARIEKLLNEKASDKARTNDSKK